MFKHIFTFLILAVANTNIMAKIDLPAIFSDHMVIQRDQPIKIWGSCKYESEIQVIFNGIEKNAVVDNGRFEISFDALPKGGPYLLKVIGTTTITIKDIFLGDVFVLGGQSNMEWQTKQIDNSKAELSNASFPSIRLFKVPHILSSKKNLGLEGTSWQLSDSTSAADFSAIGFLLGRDLHLKYDVPIGLIDNSWGGTDIKGWLPEEAFVGYSKYVEQIEVYKKSPFANVDIVSFMDKWIENMDLLDEGNFGGWGFPSTSKNDWDEAKLPGKWEYNGLPGYNGIMWYSRKFEAAITETDTCTISLGKIDDEDLVYINGMAIGSTQNYSMDRHYKVPKSVLFESDNEIVVRVKDSGGDGGFWGSPTDMQCTCGNQQFPLSGIWKMKQGTPNYQELPIEFGANAFPTNRYNAMVYPLTKLKLKGYLYYQGEADAGRHEEYGDLFSRLIRLYRSAWNDQKMPFIFVQLANFGRYSSEPTPNSTWAGLRNAQASVLTLPYTGMATAIDLGVGNDIHPTDKQSVANRLSLVAQNLCYGENVASLNPSLQSVTLRTDKITLRFLHTGNGLKRKDYSSKIEGFTIQDQDGNWKNVDAKILSANAVSLNINFAPKAIKYLWSNNPENINLYNSVDLPVLPFSWINEN